LGEATTADIKSGEAIFVPTGAQKPISADAVVMIEYCETLPPATVRVHNEVGSESQHNVQRRGLQARRETDRAMEQGSRRYMLV